MELPNPVVPLLGAWGGEQPWTRGALCFLLTMSRISEDCMGLGLRVDPSFGGSDADADSTGDFDADSTGDFE